MTLLFIENRYKTYFFEAIATQLVHHGFKVHFMIQNKSFLPKKEFTNHIIPYPQKRNKNHIVNQSIEEVIISDRQQNYFNKEDQSYFYYYNDKISDVLDAVNPDVVFGESTAFRELLTINLCKQKNILYLNPSSCRFPIGRFSFYKYDTLEPYKGSGELLDSNTALKTIHDIVYRTAKPDYMKAVGISKKAKITDKIKLIKGYFEGECYNTPNPVVKYRVEKQKTRNISDWDAISESQLNCNKFTILYPLQMQPEANIDVWGNQYRNQTQLIQRISDVIKDEAILVVKPNPKSKYELSEEMVNLVKERNNIVGLTHSTTMDSIFPKIDLVITVTGTIAIESILSNKPVVTMVKTLNNTVNNCLYVENIEDDIASVIQTIKNRDFPKINDVEKTNFINLLNKTSYKGIISDPFSDANCISEINLNFMENAFINVLNNLR